jgi:uncharacterized protein with von Willebrand factor type A (vWA) domain
MTGSTTAPAHPAEEVLLAFTRALRSAGVAVTEDRAQSFLVATALVGLHDRAATYRAGRATLCAGPEDLARYEQVFAAWFDRRGELPRTVPSAAPATAPALAADDDAAGEPGDDAIRLAASGAEVLRHRDVATLTAGEKQRLAAMFTGLQVRPPRRRTSRHEQWRRGSVDGGRTLRASLRRMGEPAQVVRRRRTVRARRVVLLVDVSGSMNEYADSVLRLAHRIATGPTDGGWGSRPVEVFTLGTRLTRVTRAMRLHDPERALAAAGETVPDWSGGTRLGETLKAFLDRWGARGLARGAVVVMFSDGWERGDAVLLGEQMQRLRRIAHRVVWVNPHRGKVGYAPVQQGVVAALPHCDDFVAGHSLATFDRLLEVIARA